MQVTNPESAPLSPALTDGPGLSDTLRLDCHTDAKLVERLPDWEAFVLNRGIVPLSQHPRWPLVLEAGLGHTGYCLEAFRKNTLVGFLPLAHVRSLLFGAHLVSLPYLNYGGVMAEDAATESALLERAACLADQLNVNYLELRQTRASEHPRITHTVSTKVHMRLPLPGESDVLWKQLDGKVRNQIRKGQKSELTVSFGGLELLDAFYDVFSRNMRDLGTPVYGVNFFQAILRAFPERAEFCVVRLREQPIAAALLFHGWGVSEVPSASSLREFNSTNANMLMYWHLLLRAIERGQGIFDFGRSSADSNTYKFKAQWGAEPHPAVWQYVLRRGDVKALRPESYGRAVQVWKRLPLFLTRWLGPMIVRGIP